MTTKPYALDLTALGPDEKLLEGAIPAGDIDFSGGDVSQLGDLGWSAKLEAAGTGVRFVGQLSARIQLSCDRCVNQIHENIERRFDLFFEQRESELFKPNDEVELEEADTDTAFIVGNELFVDEVMHEQVLLALPMKPLCSADCKGLCSTCGTNLNDGNCGCPEPVTNPAFEHLLEFKKRLQDQGDSAG
jgi:uncharacterized protein